MKSFANLNVVNLGDYFHKLAESSQDVFWIKDIDYKTVLYVSPAYEKVWGVSCKDGESWLAAVHADDRLKVDQQLHSIRTSPRASESYVQDYRIHRPDGELRWIHEVSFPLFDAEQAFIGFAGIAKDVTLERRHLEELELATRFFFFFAEKVKIAFWARDETCGKQLYLSPGYEKIWGRTRESLYKNPASWIETLFPEDRDQHTAIERMRNMEKKGPDTEYIDRYRIMRPDGEVRWIKDTSFPIQNEKQKFIGFAGIAEDVTQEVINEKELLEAKQRAEAANEAKSEFLAMISHEIRTPLNAILGMAQILKMKGLPEGSQEYVDIISNAGNSLLSLVGDILDFARLEAGKLSISSEPFDLKNLFDEVILSMQYMAKEKNIELKVEYFSEIPKVVVGDINRVRQVIVNLLSNALKFTEKGFVKAQVNVIQQLKDAAVLEVKVIDTGVGIPSNKLQTIFEKFSQIDSIYNRKQRGIGLGLPITKELIEKMGGSIYVTSELQKGSEFSFTLPLTIQCKNEKLQCSLNVKNNKVISPHRSKYNFDVLLVEDNLINQKIAKLMLEDFGCRVDIANNGREVFDKVKQLLDYDIIFMDVGLPDMSGFEIVSLLRQNPDFKNIPIIAMTAHILERDREQAIISGMNKVVAKPISTEELAAVLDEYAIFYRGKDSY